jgi:hypothetical protein
METRHRSAFLRDAALARAMAMRRRVFVEAAPVYADDP